MSVAVALAPSAGPAVVEKAAPAQRAYEPDLAPPPGWDAPWWKALGRRWGHVFHSMCSYMGMFPATLPRYFIEQFTEPGDVVVDPFSGRGTTALEACLSGRVGLGIDLNPLAALLTAAKVDAPSHADALARLNELEKLYPHATVTDRAPPEISMLYDGRRTLPQLLFLRSALDPTQRVDRFLLAALVGILHGNHTRDPLNARCLSVSMPNTFSMSPGYLRKYIAEKQLKKYPYDAFEKMRLRLAHLYAQGAPPARGAGVHGSALELTRYVAPGSAKLIVTSPPYLNVVRYGKFNWIRLWMLKESVERVDSSLKEHQDLSLQVEQTDRQLGLSDRLNFRRYCEFLRLSLTESAKALRPDGLCVVAIGDVRVGERDRQLALDAWKLIERDVPLTLHTAIEDAIEPSIKVSRIWGDTKGRATRCDRVLVLGHKGSAAPKPRYSRPAELLTHLAAQPMLTDLDADAPTDAALIAGEEPAEKPTAARRSKRSAGARKSRSV